MTENTPERYYTEELVYVDREDGLALEGALVLPADVARFDIATIEGDDHVYWASTSRPPSL